MSGENRLVIYTTGLALSFDLPLQTNHIRQGDRTIIITIKKASNFCWKPRDLYQRIVIYKC